MGDTTNLDPMPQENNSTARGLYNGKYATYFSTMNPLAARIYEDIQKVESKYENFGRLSYDEKCAVIDKHLLFNTRSSGDISHTAAMLMSVAPSRKSDDNGDQDSSGLTGKHCGRFTTCTEIEIEACRLGKLLKKVTLVTKKKKQGSSMSKKPKKAPAPKPTLSRSSTESYGFDDTRASNANRSHPPEGQSWCREEELKNCEIEPSACTVKKPEPYKPKLLSKAEITYDVEENDDRLPQQKQNLDLIAELQAKLKRNKEGSSGNSPVLKVMKVSH